jgi:hypothetical protein
MVSRKQLVLILAITPAFAQPRFYSDDPLTREPAPRPVKQIAVRKVDDIYSFLEGNFATPRREGKQARLDPRRALDVNTIGEVPDSAWYTNRHAFHRMSIADLERGPGNSTPPSQDDSWRIIGAKTDGVTPGFIIEDQNQNRYILKLDPPHFPELCSAADVIGSKFFYALGYNTPENYVVFFHRESLVIAPGVHYRDPENRKRPLTEHVLSELLAGQRKSAGGTYRAMASRWVGGEVVGPFSYRKVRTDDPNDVVPHEDRRMLRGLAVFSAWLNHHDTRSINTMDTLVEEDGRRYLKHYLIDFGSILGSAGYAPKEAWIGHRYVIQQGDTAKRLMTLGFVPPRWARAEYPKLGGVGLFDSWSFEPLSWRPFYPNPAFEMMDDVDAFWAAKQVAAFTDEEIRAIVKTGKYSDSRAEAWIADCLIERRDKLVKAWFSRVLPLDRFRVDNDRLAFDDLGVQHGVTAARDYRVDWSVFDNDRQQRVPIADASGVSLPRPPAGTEYLAAAVSCREDSERKVVVYLKSSGGRFHVVGLDR